MTVDLEPDFLSEDSHEVLLDEARFGQFAETLNARGVPVSVFLAAKMLDEGLPVRERFDALDAEFELHSYFHDPGDPDSLDEIRRAKHAYRTHFGRDPIGYRAPLGFISAEGVRALASEGFEYSASIFPSNRRELGFDHGKLPLEPWMWSSDGNDLLVEIPFAVTKKPRVVVCESYLKLLGMGPFRALYSVGGFPDTLVIDSHLYDFFPTSAVLGLSRFDGRRYALLRNQRRALALLDRLITFLQRKGYRFVKVEEVHAACRARGAELPRVDLSSIEGTRYKVPPRPSETRGAQA